jgi:oligopeptidase A
MFVSLLSVQVLGLGGGRAPELVYRDFRGRDPTPDALLRHNGLLPATA